MNHLHLPGVVGNYASVPNVANLDGTGTLEFIAKVNLDDWTPAAGQVWISKWTGSAGYLFFLEAASNDLKLMWRDSGPARIAQATVTPTAGGDGWLWVMAVATEDGVDRDVFFYTSTDTTDDSDDVTWTQLGAEVVVPFGGGDLVTNTARVFIGAQSHTVATMAGSIAAARINFNGVTELDIDFTDLTAAEVDAGSFTEDSGNAATVTITGTAWAYIRPPATRVFDIGGSHGCSLFVTIDYNPTGATNPDGSENLDDARLITVTLKNSTEVCGFHVRIRSKSDRNISWEHTFAPDEEISFNVVGNKTFGDYLWSCAYTREAA